MCPNYPVAVSYGPKESPMLSFQQHLQAIAKLNVGTQYCNVMTNATGPFKVAKSDFSSERLEN